MQMTSLLFLLYFLPAVAIVYHLLRFSIQAQNVWLLAASLLFYALGSVPYALLLGVIILLNYALGFAAERAREARRGAGWFFLAAGLVNLGPLFVFRYLPALTGLLEGLLEMPLAADFPAPPLGIVFIALMGISYLMDIFRGEAYAERSPVHCALYLSFFPTLFAGPILRYRDIAPQMAARKVTLDDFAEGVCRILVGLAKLVLLAGPLTALADAAFNTSNISGTYTVLPAATALLGLLGFILQLYYQLSGFSDMAIGLGRLFGFRYAENFNYPIAATSITDFWRRTYRSLTLWFETYVYEPLCARSANRDRQLLYSFIMWLLIGIWLGPSLSSMIFVLWVFAFLVVEQILELDGAKGRRGIRRFYVVLVMSIGMVALRTDTIYEFSLYIGNLFGLNGNGFSDVLSLTLLKEFWPMLAAGILFMLPIAPLLTRLAGRSGTARAVLRVLLPVALLALAALAFIYVVRSGSDAGLLSEYRMWSWYNG